MKRLFQLLIIAVAILILGDMAARSQGTGAGGSGPWTLSGTIILPKSASVDWVRITGDAAGPRIGSTAGNDILFDPDNDAAAEASISNAGVGTFDSIVTSDKEASDEGNYLAIFDDDAAGGTAFDGTANNFTIGDIDESATDNYCFFLDTTSKFCVGATIVTTADWDFGGGGIEIENGTTPPSCTEGQLYLDTDATSGSRLMACEGTTFVTQGGGGGFTSFDIDGDNNSPQTITNGNEALFVGGVGIDTTAGATDQVSFAFDATEITGARSWSDGTTDVSIAWTFNLNAGTDPVVTFGNNSVDFSTPVSASTFTSDDQQAANNGNYLYVLDDDNDGAETPFAGIADTFSIGDVDETATDTYCMFKGTTKRFCPPAESVTTTHALFATATSGEPAFRTIAATDLPAHADAGADTTTWVLLGLAQTGTQTPATDAGLAYNASTDVLTTKAALDTASTAVLQAADTNTTAIATTSFVQQEIEDAGNDGRSVTGAATGVINADAELYTHTKCMTLEAPATADDWLWFRVDTAGAGSTWTVTGVDCLSTGTTPSVTLTINEAGATGTVANAIEAGLVCDNAGDSEAGGLDDATIDNTDWIRIDPTAVSGTVTQTSVCITYTVAD